MNVLNHFKPKEKYLQETLLHSLAVNMYCLKLGFSFMAVYSSVFLTMQSQNEPAFALYGQESSSICHSNGISDCMFQSHVQVDYNPTLAH